MVLGIIMGHNLMFLSMLSTLQSRMSSAIFVPIVHVPRIHIGGRCSLYYAVSGWTLTEDFWDAVDAKIEVR